MRFSFHARPLLAPAFWLVIGLAAHLPAAEKKPDQPKLTVMPATGSDTVLFSKDIAPVLVDNCFSCHSGPQPRAKFQMNRFVDIIRGGLSGNPWVPSQPADSLLIKKLKGTEGKRMPQPDKRDPLPPETIAKFEKWISEGAHFDGPDPKGSVQMLAALTHAKDASPTELASDRMTAAKHMWLLADPNDTPNFKETKELLLVSNLSADQLNDVAATAEREVAAVAKQFHVPSSQPLVKGGITLFVFPDRYEYSEFGQMVESRTLPRDWRGHWKYNTIDAYAAVVPPGENGDDSLAGLIQQQLAAVYLASLPGTPPDWFAEGSARVLASRADPKAARVRDWNDRFRELADTGNRLAKFIDHGLSPNDNDVAAYGFVKELMTNSGKYSQLISALRDGEPFDAAFQRIYGSPLSIAVIAWSKAAH
jgi:Planctomycete cytochrome C